MIFRAASRLTARNLCCRYNGLKRFPASVGAAQTASRVELNGDNDAFAVKLDLTGRSTLWGTLLPGMDSDSGLAVAVNKVAA